MNESTLSTDASAILHGKGIFSTIAIYDGQPFLWEKHWRRLTENAGKVGIDLSQHSKAATRARLDAAVATGNLVTGRARISFLDETPSQLWSNVRDTKTTLSIMSSAFRAISAQFRLNVSRYTVNSRSPLAGVKSCNYLEHLNSLDEAKKRGFDEAIRLNERDVVTSACMANVFWLKDGEMFTPSLSTGCLPGTTREFVLENLDCEEVEATIDELEKADAIFLTSAGLGVVQVAELDSRTMPELKHPITDILPGTR